MGHISTDTSYFLLDWYFLLVFTKLPKTAAGSTVSPIMVSLLNPFAIDFFSGCVCQPWCGCEPSRNRFSPLKDWKWKASFQPLCTKLDCALVSRGVVCFCRVFSRRKGQTSRTRSSLLSHVIYGYSTTEGCKQSPGLYAWYKDTRLLPFCQVASQDGS